MTQGRKKNGSVTPNAVRARVNALHSDMESLQRDMRGMVSDVEGAAVASVQNAAAEAFNSAQEAAERARHWGNENIEGMRDVMRQQPLTAFALAMGAGAVLGAIFLRR